MVFSGFPFNVDSTIGMAKDSAQWFQHSSNWLTISKSMSTQFASNSSSKNPSFIIKQYPNSDSVLQTCFLHVDGASKEGNAWSALGFTASHPDGSLIAQQTLSTYIVPLQFKRKFRQFLKLSNGL